MKCPERVYLVTLWFADFGGLENHLTELALALRRRGTAVWVFSEAPVPLRNQYRQKLEAAGIPFWSPRLPAGLTHALWRHRGSWLYRALSRFQRYIFRREHPHDDDLAASATLSASLDQALEGGILNSWLRRAMEKLAAQEPPDVVHVHGFRLTQPWVTTWGATRGLSVVYTEHSTIADWGTLWGAQAERFVGAAGDIACVSAHSQASLSARLPGRNISVHHHILRVSEDAVVPRPAGVVRLISVARLRWEKGLDVLLRAVARVRKGYPGFHLVILGDGPDRSKLEALCAELDLKSIVEFMGQQPHEDITKWLQQAEVFVLASRTEGLPLSLLEAMAHGLAIVATSVGGIPELIRSEETGLLVPPNCPEALGDALETVIQDADKRLKLRRAARLAFEHSPHQEGEALRALLTSYERASQEAILARRE